MGCTARHAGSFGLSVVENSLAFAASRRRRVKQAQGADWSGPLIGAAVTGGIFLAMLLLIDGDDTGPVTSTTTSP